MRGSARGKFKKYEKKLQQFSGNVPPRLMGHFKGLLRGLRSVLAREKAETGGPASRHSRQGARRLLGKRIQDACNGWTNLLCRGTQIIMTRFQRLNKSASGAGAENAPCRALNTAGVETGSRGLTSTAQQAGKAGTDVMSSPTPAT